MMGFGRFMMGNAVALFFRKLALMVGSGVKLPDALDAISQGLPGGQHGPPFSGRIRGAMAQVAQDVRRGGALSAALEQHPHLFPPDLIAILKSGEMSGDVHGALVKIADALEDGTLRAGRRRGGMPWFFRGHHHEHHEHRGPPPPPPPPHHRGHHEHRAHHHHHHGERPPPPPPHPSPNGSRAIELFAAAARARASDIHVEPLPQGGRVRFRVDGRLQEHRALGSATEYQAVVDAIKDWAAMDVNERKVPQDARALVDVEGQRINMSVAAAPYIHGEAVTVRLTLPTAQIPPLTDLHFSEAHLARVRRWIARSHGLIVITGPSGSGKTTTVYSLLASYDANTRKVISVEQPVEHVLPGINQLALSPELGATWASALRTQLRHDPDVVMVGEVQNPEVAELVFKTALSGHVVLTQFHADSVASLLGRLAALGLPEPLVREALTGVIAQRLVRRLCSNCRERVDQPALPAGTAAALPAGNYYRAMGCAACGHTGYHGRLAVYELAEPGEVAAPTLLADGLEKAAQGLTSIDEVLRECLV